MKKSRPGATTVLAKAKTEWNSEKKKLEKKIGERRDPRKGLGRRKGRRHPFPFPDYRSACFARQIFCFALSNFPFSA